MKVLVCEDDEIVLKVIQVALESYAVEAKYAKDGYRALQYLNEQKHFDLIITDIHMPYHNGDEILRMVREIHGKKTPIIMISSDTEEEVIKLALKLGVDEFISKPVEPHQLTKKLKKYLKT